MHPYESSEFGNYVRPVTRETHAEYIPRRMAIVDIYVAFHRVDIYKEFKNAPFKHSDWILDNTLRRDDGRLCIVDFARATYWHLCQTRDCRIDCRQRFAPRFRCIELSSLLSKTEVFEEGKRLLSPYGSGLDCAGTSC